MINFWKMTYEAIREQRDKYKTERDTCLEDIEKLRERNKELERENERLLNQSNYYARHVELGEERLKQLLPKEHNYVVLTSHIRMKAEHNPGVSRYIDLVNYIDRLEDKESDTTHHIPHLTNINIKDNTEEPMKFIKRIAKERD